MILEFGAKNFYSFKEGFEVNLRSNDKKSPQSAFNVLAVKGANASGKTNVLKLLQFIKSFVLNSFSDIKPDEEILIDSYFNNNEPIEIFIVFLSDGVEYKYELSLTNHEVLSEKFSKKLQRKVKILERKANKITYAIDEFAELKTIKLRNNVSIVSTALQHDIDSVELLENLFKSITTNVNAFGRNDQLLNQYDTTSKFYHSSEVFFSFVKDVLKKSDTGIDDIKIYDKKNEASGEIDYITIFEFLINGETKSLTFYDQSSGTKSLYLQLGHYKAVLQLGYTLVLDEFDINLHPDLLPMLVDFFDDPVKNVNNAQLIFTTHNTDIMDKLGKYRVVLVNKHDNESFLYRLDEIPGDILRNDRPITPVYKAGKIGGKPKLTV